MPSPLRRRRPRPWGLPPLAKTAASSVALLLGLLLLNLVPLQQQATAFVVPSHPRPPRPPATATAAATATTLPSSLDERVAEIERILDAHLYPPPPTMSSSSSTSSTRSSDARKTLAFESQDRFLDPATTTDTALTKPHLTYGEFPLASVARILAGLPPLGPNDVFLDLGSGCGRLVLGASLLWPGLRACVGMELLPELHALAVEAHRRALADPAFLALGLPRSPCRFVRGDAEAPTWLSSSSSSSSTTPTDGDENDDHLDPRLTPAMGGTDPLASATAVFAYATTWRSEDPLHLAPPLHAALLRRLGKEAAPEEGGRVVVVVTTDKRFRDGVVTDDEAGRRAALRWVGSVEVPNPEVFESTAHVHELVAVVDGAGGDGDGGGH